MADPSEKKILVVDDEPDVRNFLAACIEDAGFNVETAADGIEAMQKIQSAPPDLMTLDMVMPRQSGIALMRRLRSMEQFTRLPVIIITAHAHDELGSEDIRSFDGFTSGLRPRYIMDKPVTPKKLVEAICDILHVHFEEPLLPLKENERQRVMKMVGQTDSTTLRKIQALLKNKSQEGVQ